MYPQIDQTAAPRHTCIPEPGALRPVCIMEREVRGEWLAKLAFANALADRLRRRRVAIAEIDPEQAVRSPGGIEHGRNLTGASREGLLAEHRGAGFKRTDALLGVKRARRCDHDSGGLASEQLLERSHAERSRRKFECLRRHLV